MRTGPIAPVELRGGVAVGNPLGIVVRYLESWVRDMPDPAPATFGESDLRAANRAGARISAAEIAAILQRRGAIAEALGAIAPDASLTGDAASVPWLPLRQLLGAFADIRGVGLSKATKTLHRKRPELIPMLDSVVQGYLADDDPGAAAAFGERALALVRGYKADLDANAAALEAVRRELARLGYGVTEVRILDLLIWSVAAPERV